jgi:hypothetical protein
VHGDSLRTWNRLTAGPGFYDDNHDIRTQTTKYRLWGAGTYMFLSFLRYLKQSAPSTMPPQQYLVDTAGAILIGLVFSAVYVPAPGERSESTSSSDADTAGYMESRVSKHSRTTSMMITQIASF